MAKWSEASDWIDSSSGSGVAHFFFESRVTVLNWIPAMIQGNIFYVASLFKASASWLFNGNVII